MKSSQAAFLKFILSKGKAISRSPIKRAHQNSGGLEYTLLNGVDLQSSLLATKIPHKQTNMETPEIFSFANDQSEENSRFKRDAA